MKSKMVLFVSMCVMGMFFADATAATINFPGGRIAYSADGNQHDHDDIGATAASIAMVSSAGLGNKLVHYDFSNHLGNNNKEMENNMIESALGGPNGGNQQGGPKELKNLLSNPVKAPESRTEKESAQNEPAKLIYSGRLAVSHDGNIHDEDDWGALAFVWGIVASFGMQEKLVHVDHSDHLVDNTARGEKQMILSAEGWKYFPGFDSSIVFNDWRDLEGAIANFKKQAEAGSETNILSYMCAGPMDVPWQCINAVTPSKRKFIRVISHAGWNNNHTWKNPDGSKSHTWNDMISSFESDGVKFEKIPVQNTHLGPGDSDWSFLNNMPDNTCIPASAWKWMFSREQKHSDVSDCGMTWYCLTGDVRGTDKKFETRFKNPIDFTTDAK